MREIDLSNIPRLENGRYDWRNSKNCVCDFSYDNIRGQLKIIDYELNKNSNNNLIVEYKGVNYRICPGNFKNGKLNSIVSGINTRYIKDNFSHRCLRGKHYLYDVGEIIDNHTIIFRYYDSKYGNGRKLRYVLKCNHCGYLTDMSQPQLNNHHRIPIGCRVCSNIICVHPINDIFTCRKDMISFFDDIDDTKLYTPTSSKTIYPNCPCCGKKSKYKYRIYDLSREKFVCHNCSDGISNGEKFLICFLDQIKQKYIYQAGKNDIYFIEDLSRFDFCLIDKKIFIEVDGEQHRKDKFRQLCCEIKKKDNIKDCNAIIHGFRVIRLDYDGNLDNFIYEVKHKLSFLINGIDNIDWIKCIAEATTNKYFKFLEYLIMNNFPQLKESALRLDTSKSSLHKTLKIGKMCGVLDTDKNRELKKNRSCDMIKRIRLEMIDAMKNKNYVRKNTLSMLLQALQKAEKDKIGTPLTDAEADAVVMKEIKQTQETLDTCPTNRTDIIEECQQRIAILQEFAPKQLDKEEIEAVIREVFAEVGIESPTKKDKGKVMKVLMPKVKGKADGKLVNQILDGMLS